MRIQIDNQATVYNTKYAPLAVLLAHYKQNQILAGLEKVSVAMKTREFTPASKLQQVLFSILAGCQYIVEVNSKLKSEQALAQVWGLKRFAEQSTLSSTLDALTQMNSDQIQAAVMAQHRRSSGITGHDWRGFLWLDFDLSGLPCGKQGERASKGYFSDKKTWLVVN